MLNNLNLEALGQYVDLVKEKPEEGLVDLGVTAHWKGGVNSEITTHRRRLGSRTISKTHTFQAGEPNELLGDDQTPNPQDYILGGMAACMMVGFVAAATTKGIELQDVQLSIVGKLDLRGFLDLDPTVTVGFEELEFKFDVKGNGTEEQYDEIIRHVQKVSPGYHTIADPVKISVNNSL